MVLAAADTVGGADVVRSTNGGMATVEAAGGSLVVTMAALSAATAGVTAGTCPEACSSAVVVVTATIADNVAVVL